MVGRLVGCSIGFLVGLANALLHLESRQDTCNAYDDLIAHFNKVRDGETGQTDDVSSSELRYDMDIDRFAKLIHRKARRRDEQRDRQTKRLKDRHTERYRRTDRLLSIQTDRPASRQTDIRVERQTE